MTSSSLFVLLLILLLDCSVGKKVGGVDKTEVVTVTEHKEWKKLLRTRLNVLALFSSGDRHVESLMPAYNRVATAVRGQGTLLYVDCSNSKKLCSVLKVKPATFELKHYQDGKFHKDYDRLLTEKSLLSFLKDPSADPPWSEDVTANDVRHVETPSDFHKLIRQRGKRVDDVLRSLVWALQASQTRICHCSHEVEEKICSRCDGCGQTRCLFH